MNCYLRSLNLNPHLKFANQTNAKKQVRLIYIKQKDFYFKIILTFAKIAKELEASIDRSIDPCEDFYQFACGRWIKANPIREDRTESSTFDITGELLLKNVKGT